jgi:hypothetical protein
MVQATISTEPVQRTGTRIKRDLPENRGVTPRHGLVPIRLIPLMCRSVQEDPLEWVRSPTASDTRVRLK